MEVAFKQTYVITPRIGSGREGYVYKLSNHYVGKVLRNWSKPYWADDNDKFCLENELANLKFLHENGVSVPRPYGIKTVNIRWIGNMLGLFGFFEKEALVMQKLVGRNIRRLQNSKYRQRAEELYNIELQKMADLGYHSNDHSSFSLKSGYPYNNAIYNIRQDKIFLFDFLNAF